jgi:hypothetical protein
MTKGQKKAMRHSNKLGAGAKARKHLRGQKKVEVVMKEFKRGTLHSGSGEVVKNRKQAIAIAMSEAGLSRKKKTRKQRRATGRMKWGNM